MVKKQTPVVDFKIIEKKDSLKNRVKKSSFLFLANNVLSELKERPRKIIQSRFGLTSGKCETLEEVGKKQGITRERIRQIIIEAIKKISSNPNHKSFSEAIERIIFTINQNGGIIKKSDILEKFVGSDLKDANAVIFFISCSGKIFEAEGRGFFEKVFFVSEKSLSEAKKIVSEAQKIISEKKVLFTDQEIFDVLLPIMPHLSKKQIINFLGISSIIKKNRFGKWGMIDWSEVNPRGTREKVYLILKEKGAPLHFTEIAEYIDELKFNNKKAHPQTVHNELIKDEKFILIGRGIYALKEWGYFKGTTREVIKGILEKSKKPLKKEKVLEEVLKIRKVKKTTILINLNNEKFFKKTGNFYSNIK